MTQSFDSAPPPAQTPITSPAASSMDQRSMAIAQLAQQTQNSSRNFYWIAALSFINSLITAFGGEFYLVMGLAATLFTDYMAVGMAMEAPELAMILKIVAIVISLFVSGIIALFGWLAGKGKRWAYIVGMVLYALDAGLMLVFQEWKGLLVHLFFLWILFTGLKALNQLQKLVPPQQKQTDFPQNIGVS